LRKTNPEQCKRAVSFPDGEALLAGTLTMPPTCAPLAGVVMIQGSGPADRDNSGYFVPIRDHLARHGIAVLCYDKPGIGGSSGDWRGQTLRDRAVEALAALHFLQGRDDVGPTRVGLYGHSQGGWAVPLAASMSRDVAFVVAVSGPGVCPAEQGVYAVEHGMRADGWSEDQVAEAVAFVARVVDAARRDEDFASIEPALRRARDHAWFASLPKYFPIPDAELWGFSRRRDPVTDRAFVDYQPVPVLERVTCPVLAIFGQLDWVVPVERSAAIYETALTRAGNQHFAVTVFPKADHRIRIADPDDFAPGFLDAVTGWILRHADPTRDRRDASVPITPSAPTRRTASPR